MGKNGVKTIVCVYWGLKHFNTAMIVLPLSDHMYGTFDIHIRLKAVYFLGNSTEFTSKGQLICKGKYLKTPLMSSGFISV